MYEDVESDLDGDERGGERGVGDGDNDDTWWDISVVIRTRGVSA